MIARLHQAEEYRADRAHPRGGHERGLGPFQRGDAIGHHPVVERVHVARVAHLVVARVVERRGGDDGGVQSLLGGSALVSGVHAGGLRVPDLVVVVGHGLSRGRGSHAILLDATRGRFQWRKRLRKSVNHEGHEGHEVERSGTKQRLDFAKYARSRSVDPALIRDPKATIRTEKSTGPRSGQACARELKLGYAGFGYTFVFFVPFVVKRRLAFSPGLA